MTHQNSGIDYFSSFVFRFFSNTTLTANNFLGKHFRSEHSSAKTCAVSRHSNKIIELLFLSETNLSCQWWVLLPVCMLLVSVAAVPRPVESLVSTHQSENRTRLLWIACTSEIKKISNFTESILESLCELGRMSSAKICCPLWAGWRFLSYIACSKLCMLFCVHWIEIVHFINTTYYDIIKIKCLYV